MTLHASNWRRIVLSALILASKVWEDQVLSLSLSLPLYRTNIFCGLMMTSPSLQAVWNVDFLSIFPNITVSDLNKLEKHVLHMLQFNVTLKVPRPPHVRLPPVTSPQASWYTKYYFELREISDLGDQEWPLKPLDKASAKLLEVPLPFLPFARISELRAQRRSG